jgi:hypothetical protein
MVQLMTMSSGKDEEIARLNREIARLKQRIEELEKLLAAQSALPTNNAPAAKVPLSLFWCLRNSWNLLVVTNLVVELPKFTILNMLLYIV